MVTVKLEGGDNIIKALEGKQGDLKAAIEAILMVGAEIIRQAAASRTKGKIAANMTKEKLPGSPITVGIGPSKRQWYARFREFGTKAHSVKPRRAKALQVGLDTFRASVRNHPGTAAQPFLRPALDENGGDAQAAMGNEVKRVLDL